MLRVCQGFLRQWGQNRTANACTMTSPDPRAAVSAEVGSSGGQLDSYQGISRREPELAPIPSVLINTYRVLGG
jgi:hypothetical protein